MESCNTSLDVGEMKNNCSQESADSISDLETSVKNGVGKNLVPGEKSDFLRNKSKGEQQQQQNVSLDKDKIDSEESKENQLSKLKSPIDKITVEDESDVIITSSEKLEKAEKKPDSSSKGETDPLKVVIKLTDSNENSNKNPANDDDEVEVLNTAAKINTANNGVESVAKENQRKVNDLNPCDRSRLHLQSSNCQSNSLLTSNSNNQLRSGPFSANNNHNKVQQPPELPSFNLASQQNSYAPLSGAKILKPHIPSMSPLNSSQSGMNSSKGGTSPFCSTPNFSNFNINDNDDSKDTLPNSSVEQIEAIKRETLLHSMSTKAQRILKAKAKAELLMKADEKLGPLANFLNNLGLDIVKQSVYQEAIHIQSRKQQSGKLTDVECSQLDKMRTSCRELAEKLKHLKLSYRKCKLCNFVSESVNVHFWHREHPHVNKREDFCCSYCDFLTRNNLAFNFHMEAEHNIKGRSMEKPAFWQCSLCPFEHNSKSKLTQHRWKCEKNFEMKTHLSPSPETDINYSLYGVFYLSEKEEALKAIALHKAKQNQIKAQQAQFKLQQQQAAANRASYFNANKISPIQSKPMNQGNMNVNQRIPVLVHPKIGQPQVPGNQIRNFNARGSMQPNRFQQQSPIRPMVNHLGMKHFSPGMPQNNIRGTSLINPNKGHQNLSLMRTQLPVKDLLNMHQQIKGHNVVTAKSLANQKLIPSSNQPINDVSEFEICELCGGYVKDREALRIHFFYAHRVEMPALMFEKPCPPLFCDVCEKKFWTSQGLQKHRVSLKHYAKGSLSQVCILCGCLVSHLLNHMTDTHQLNLQDFLNQKRCIVCGKVCQSRSETEIHMAASHGILVKRSNSNSMDAKVKLDEKGGGNSMAMATKTGTATPGSSASQLVKGNYCVFCKVPFASNAELTQHCLLVHKACKKCGMVLPAEGSLGNHRCQISIPTVKACSVCKKQILIQEFIKHVEEKHLKKCSIKLKRLNSEEINAEMKEKKLHLDISGGASPCSVSGNIDSGQNSISGDVGSISSARSHKRKPEESDRAAKRSKISLDNDSNFEAKSESISISDSDDDVEVINAGSSSADKTKLDYPKNGSVDKEKESSKTGSVSESAAPEKMDVDESRDSEEESDWSQKGAAVDKDKQDEQENTTANNKDADTDGSTSAKLESSKEPDGSMKTPVKSGSDKNLTDCTD